MGWREVITQTVWDYTGCTDARAETTCAGIEDRLADMPAPDRIALARELLAGTGMLIGPWEFTREQLAKLDDNAINRIEGTRAYRYMLMVADPEGCRAAMLEPDDAGG